jgi:hypothetical protein
VIGLWQVLVPLDLHYTLLKENQWVDWIHISFSKLMLLISCSIDFQGPWQCDAVLDFLIYFIGLIWARFDFSFKFVELPVITDVGSRQSSICPLFSNLYINFLGIQYSHGCFKTWGLGSPLKFSEWTPDHKLRLHQQCGESQIFRNNVAGSF